ATAASLLVMLAVAAGSLHFYGLPRNQTTSLTTSSSPTSATTKASPTTSSTTNVSSTTSSQPASTSAHTLPSRRHISRMGLSTSEDGYLYLSLAATVLDPVLRIRSSTFLGLPGTKGLRTM